MKALITKAVATAAVGSLFAVACAAPVSSNGNDTAENARSTTEGLHEAACTTVTPNATGSGRAYQQNVGSSYGSSTCPQQFVLQMNGVPAPFGGGNLTASVGPTSAVSQALCGDTEGSIDLWGSNDNVNWTHISGSSAYGTWETGSGIIGSGCSYGQGYSYNISAAVPVNGPYYTNYRVVGAILQHPSNKGTSSDVPIATTVTFDSLGLE